MTGKIFYQDNQTRNINARIDKDKKCLVNCELGIRQGQHIFSAPFKPQASI